MNPELALALGITNVLLNTLCLVGLILIMLIKVGGWVESRQLLEIARRHEALNESLNQKTAAILVRAEAALVRIENEGERTRAASEATKECVKQKAEEIKSAVGSGLSDTGKIPVIKPPQGGSGTAPPQNSPRR